MKTLYSIFAFFLCLSASAQGFGRSVAFQAASHSITNAPSGGGGGSYPGNLVAWWRLEDSNDCATGHANPLTFNNSPSVVSGVCGNGLQVSSGSSQTGTASSISGLSGQNTLTLSGWIKRSSGSDNNAFGKDNGSATANVQITIIGSTVYFVLGNNPAGYFYRTASAPNDTAWHHYALVWDSSVSSPGGITPYIDGVAATVSGTSGTQPLVTDSGAATFYVGKDQSNGLFSNGTFDDIRIDTRALTSGQIVTLYANGCSDACAP